MRDVKLPINWTSKALIALGNDSHSAVKTDIMYTIYNIAWNIDGSTTSTIRFISNKMIPIFEDPEINGEGFNGMAIGY